MSAAFPGVFVDLGENLDGFPGYGQITPEIYSPHVACFLGGNIGRCSDADSFPATLRDHAEVSSSPEALNPLMIHHRTIVPGVTVCPPIPHRA